MELANEFKHKEGIGIIVGKRGRGKTGLSAPTKSTTVYDCTLEEVWDIIMHTLIKYSKTKQVFPGGKNGKRT